MPKDKRKVWLCEHDDGRFWAEVSEAPEDDDEEIVRSLVLYASPLYAAAGDAVADARCWKRANPEQVAA